MSERLLHPSQLKVGDPLPFDARDARGILLLRKGHVITSVAQIEKLVTQVKTTVTASPAKVAIGQASPGESPLALALEARRCLQGLLVDPGSADFSGEVLRIGGMVRKACRANADVALASILLCCDEPYSVRHAVNVAVASYVTGQEMSLDAPTLASTVAAALTMNVGMLELQQELQALRGTLSEELRTQVQSHCEHSVELLRDRGVVDPLWLEIVRDHHERPDGSGYPAHKHAGDIAVATQLVSLGDIYCARVSSRLYRSAMAPNEALRRLFINEGAMTDEHHAARFIKTLGVYPPGTSVRLRNGSIGVVTHRGAPGRRPKVSSITTQDGLRVSVPIRRSGESEGHSVVAAVDLDELELSVSPESLWGADGRL